MSLRLLAFFRLFMVTLRQSSNFFPTNLYKKNHMHIHLRYKIALFSYRQRGTPTHALVNDTIHWFTCKYFVRWTIINKKKEEKGSACVFFIMNRILQAATTGFDLA